MDDSGATVVPFSQDQGNFSAQPTRPRQTEDTFVPRAEDLFNVPLDN